jgi:hypothetical protein
MDAKQFEIQLTEAESQLDRLKSLYEQWFQGFERLEPTILRKNFDRHLDTMRRELPRNAGLRFRFQQIVQRYTTYIVYWRRVARQIEEGTYSRDVMRARQRQSQSNRSGIPPSAPSRPPPVDEAVPQSPPEGLSAQRMAALYEYYVAARAENNERIDNINIEKLSKSVEEMLPKLREKYGDRPIDFEVVVRNGRVGIKPVVR